MLTNIQLTFVKGNVILQKSDNLMTEIIYLDYAATTPLDKDVYKEIKPFLTDHYGNSASLHSLGNYAKERVEDARENIKKKLNANNYKLIFTSGGTESNNLALKGIANSYKEKGKHIIVSKIEHDCILNTAKFLEKEGFEVTYLDVNKEGFIDLETLKKKIRKDTILVSIIHANNEIGTVQNIKEIGRICKEKETLFHTDACQSFTKIPIDLEEDNISLITINAHKIYGPKGVGALLVKNGIKITPLLHGGGHEYNLRSGTLNVSGIVGFSKATEVITKEDVIRMTELRDYLISKVLKKIPSAKLNGPKENRLCNNINFRFNYIEGESILLHLDLLGIKVSTGSACSSNTLQTNHVIKAIDVKPEETNGVIRISLGKETTKKEIEKVIEVLPIIIEKLTKMSPFSK